VGSRLGTRTLVRRGRERLTLVAARRTPTNARLLSAARAVGFAARQLSPAQARERVRPGEIVLARLDVLPTLDGIEAGLAVLDELLERGALVLNRPGALLTCHDKLATAECLGGAGVPHPATAHVTAGGEAPLPLPLVLKPRFGSWGQEVVRCRTPSELDAALDRATRKLWFARHGILVQSYVDAGARDLRVVVAAGQVVGAVERVARPGEWRTNVALGARRRPTRPPATAAATAVAAARAAGMDLVGVDLLCGPDGYHVLELNGAVDFTAEYSFSGEDVFTAVAHQLVRLTGRELRRAVHGKALAPADEAVPVVVR
jgi:RimK family alpha-L-glutamate ligase